MNIDSEKLLDNVLKKTDLGCPTTNTSAAVQSSKTDIDRKSGESFEDTSA